MSRYWTHWKALPLLLAGSFGAGAADGVIEINQAAALGGGITPADGPGFPVTIDTPGSYVLTGDLIVPDGTTGILTAADFVSLDLNGFNIEGPATCSGDGTSNSCDIPGGPAAGILVQGSYQVIRGGRIFGFEGVGVDGLGTSGVHIELADLTIVENVGYGVDLFTFQHVSIRDTRLIRNGDIGVRVGPESEIIDSQATGNRFHGFHSNGAPGVVVRRCVARLNGLEGYSINGPDSVIVDSFAAGNEGFGAGVSAAVLRGNVFDGNTGGSITGTFFQPASNVCNGDLACP